MNKISAISETFLEERANIKIKLSEFDQKINDRITYIYNVIYSAFNSELNSWKFFSGSEIEISSFDDYMKDDEIYTEHLPYLEMPIILDNKEWDLNNSLPSKWITSDNFETEFNAGMKLYQEYQAQKEAKKSKKKSKKEKFISLMKEKMTKEEMKLLKKYIN